MELRRDKLGKIIPFLSFPRANQKIRSVGKNIHISLRYVELTYERGRACENVGEKST